SKHPVSAMACFPHRDARPLRRYERQPADNEEAECAWLGCRGLDAQVRTQRVHVAVIVLGTLEHEQGVYSRTGVHEQRRKTERGLVVVLDLAGDIKAEPACRSSTDGLHELIRVDPLQCITGCRGATTRGMEEERTQGLWRQYIEPQRRANHGVVRR